MVKPDSVAVALPVASSVPVPATRVPSRNCTWPVAGVEPVVKTVAVAVVVSPVRMLSGLSDSATSVRWDAPLIATVYFDDAGLAPGLSTVWTTVLVRSLLPTVSSTVTW